MLEFCPEKLLGKPCSERWASARCSVSTRQSDSFGSQPAVFFPRKLVNLPSLMCRSSDHTSSGACLLSGCSTAGWVSDSRAQSPMSYQRHFFFLVFLFISFLRFLKNVNIVGIQALLVILVSGAYDIVIRHVYTLQCDHST